MKVVSSRYDTNSKQKKYSGEERGKKDKAIPQWGKEEVF